MAEKKFENVRPNSKGTLGCGEREEIERTYKTEEDISRLRIFIERLLHSEDAKLETIWNLSRDLRAYKTHVMHLEKEI